MLNTRLLGFIFLSIFAHSCFALDASQVFNIASQSVVQVDILNDQGNKVGVGSGVVIAKGEVITNCHVAQSSESVQVRQSEKIYKAKIHYADPDRDLCQLSVPDLNTQPLSIGTAKTLKVGQRVYAIGAPKGFELTLSEGLVSSLRDYEGSQYIQTSAAISPGSSGGGLFNDEGQLIGITTFYISEGQNLNFALPADWISELPKRTKFEKTERKESSLDWFNRSIAFEEKQDWVSLLSLSKKWVKGDSKNAFARYILGIAYGKLGQYENAVSAYLSALLIQPQYPSALNNLGNMYGNLNRYEQAADAYKKVIQLKPNDQTAWFNLGTTYTKLKQYDRAIFALKTVVEIAPKDSDAWNNLGINYYLIGDSGKVREVYLTLKALNLSKAELFFEKFVIP